MPMFGAAGCVRHACSVHFVSQAAIRSAALSGLTRPLPAIRDCRTIGRCDLVPNDTLPTISVNPDTDDVRGGSQLATSEATDVLALALRAWSAFDRRDCPALCELDEETTAMRPSSATRPLEPRAGTDHVPARQRTGSIRLGIQRSSRRREGRYR
jgi:hypothetical protein